MMLCGSLFAVSLMFLPISMLTVMNPLLLCLFIEPLPLQMSSGSRLGSLYLFW